LCFDRDFDRKLATVEASRLIGLSGTVISASGTLLGAAGRAGVKGKS
jgi:hypothetical protein